MTKVVRMRWIGSVLIISAYFILVHVDTNAGIITNMVGDGISLPYFVQTKSYDVVVMMIFLTVIGFSGLLR